MRYQHTCECKGCHKEIKFDIDEEMLFQFMVNSSKMSPRDLIDQFTIKHHGHLDREGKMICDECYGRLAK